MKYKGKKLEEITKGSLDYQRMEILMAFRSAYPESSDGPYYSVEEAFGDHLIVHTYSSRAEKLMPDEFYRVDFTQAGDIFTFAAQPWPVVELAYQPASETQPTGMGENKKGKGKRLTERIGQIALEEATESGMRRIRANDVITAGIVNGNNRRYPASILRGAIDDLRNHLHESAGQGRFIQVLGEAEHPTDKGSKRPNLLETVVRWDDVSFDGQTVSLGGVILGTSKGKDLQAVMEGGVLPGVSLRGYGEAKSIKEDGQTFDEVTALQLTGFDLVLEPSFEAAQAMLESLSFKNLEDGMDLLEQLKKLRAEHPELFQGVTDEQLKAMSESQFKKLENQIREALGIDANTSIVETMKALRADQVELQESKRQSAVEKAINEATKDLPYGVEGNKMFLEAISMANPQDGEAVKSLVEAKRKEYDKLFAGRKLEKMGFKGQISGMQSVLEAETGTPEFARPAFELAESYRRRHALARPNLKDPVTPNEVFTRAYLERFDKLNMRNVDEKGNVGGLLLESQHFEEAELTTDLNLQTSISRAIYEIVGPTLVAASIFDVGVIDTSPTRLFFKRFVGESGFSASVSSATLVADLDAWVDLTQGRLTPDTVVVKNSGGGTTYIEGTDYVVDYAAGRIKALTGGAITASQSLRVSFDYKAIRKGEMAPIERAKLTLDSMIITAAADRLADQISREAIVFSRSQLGFDAVAETLAALVQETRRIIDQGLLYAAFSAVKAVADNSTEAWTVGTDQDDLDELVRLMGAAGIIVDNRYYPANFYLASNVNAERLSHWEGFSRTGFPNAVLNAAGFAGSVNGKPIFSSTEFPSSLIIAGNQQLVMHRVFQPMLIKGPYATYDVSGGTSKLLAADQYYTEEFNVTESPINEKGAFVPVTESGS
jgi:hypothetical protein